MSILSDGELKADIGMSDADIAALRKDSPASPTKGAAPAASGPELSTKHATSYAKIEKRAHTAVPKSLGAPKTRELTAGDESDARAGFQAAKKGKDLSQKEFKNAIKKVGLISAQKNYIFDCPMRAKLLRFPSCSI